MNIRQTFGYVRRELIKKGFEVTFYNMSGWGNNKVYNYERPWTYFYMALPDKLKNSNDKVVETMNMNLNEFQKTWCVKGLGLLGLMRFKATSKNASYQGGIFEMLNLLKSDSKKTTSKQKFFENSFTSLAYLEMKFVENTIDENYKKCKNKKELFLAQITNQNFIDLYRAKEPENKPYPEKFREHFQEMNDNFYEYYSLDFDLPKKGNKSEIKETKKETLNVQNNKIERDTKLQKGNLQVSKTGKLQKVIYCDLCGKFEYSEIITISDIDKKGKLFNMDLHLCENCSSEIDVEIENEIV